MLIQLGILGQVGVQSQVQAAGGAITGFMNGDLHRAFGNPRGSRDLVQIVF